MHTPNPLEHLSDLAAAVHTVETRITRELLAICRTVIERGGTVEEAVPEASGHMARLEYDVHAQYGEHGATVWDLAFSRMTGTVEALCQRLDERRAAGIIDPGDQPLSPDVFLDGFTETERQVLVPPASTLGQAMAEYRARVQSGTAVTVDAATWTVTPQPVE